MLEINQRSRPGARAADRTGCRHAPAWLAALLLLAGAATAGVATLQPIAICDGPSCSATVFDAAKLQQFWQVQAGIRLDILPQRILDSFQFKTLTLTELSLLLGSPQLVLQSTPADPNGPAQASATALTAWFALAGFTNIFGATNLDTNIAWVTSSPVFAQAALMAELQTYVLAHEIGHMLNLPHVADLTNLMNPSAVLSIDLDDYSLTADQVSLARASRFVIDVPDGVAEPGTAALLIVGLAFLGGARRRRRRTALSGQSSDGSGKVSGQVSSRFCR